MIRYILQIGKQQILQVVYASGCNRFIYPTTDGTFYENMSRPQKEFINNSFMVEMKNADGIGTTVYYYLHRERPEKWVIDQANLREKAIERRNAKRREKNQW